MKLKPKITIADHFAQMSDPRIDRTKRHNLIDILTIAICAVICGADSWVAIELYGCTKYEWLKTFLDLPNGIPMPAARYANTRYFCAGVCTTESAAISVMFFKLDKINTENNRW